MAGSTTAKFWTDGDEEKQELVRTFYEGIERDWTAYDYVTSRRMCPCLDVANSCSFPLNGKVVRIEYRGESL